MRESNKILKYTSIFFGGVTLIGYFIALPLVVACGTMCTLLSMIGAIIEWYIGKKANLDKQ